MKFILFICFFVLIEILPFNEAVTPSENCEGYNFEDLQDRIQVKPCGKTKCRLRKSHNTTVIFKFKPSTEVQQLHSKVYATIGGLPLPFIGVDGVSACENIKLAIDGTTPAPCPLAPGVEYVYTNTFPIHNFYPSLPLRVHWGLNDGSKDVICFEVPAAIVG